MSDSDAPAARQLAQAYTKAWNSGDPQAVAAFFVPDGSITINRGEPYLGRAGIAAMAAGFYADIPDLALTCDTVRCAGGHAAYLWSFTGTFAATGNAMQISGWEEWTLAKDGLIATSLGWFDADEYARQAGM